MENGILELTNMENKIRKLLVVFRNKKYYSRNVNEGPTGIDGGEYSEEEDMSNVHMDLLRTVVIFCKKNKAIKSMMVVFRNTENYFRKMNEASGKTNKEGTNRLKVFRNKKENG